MEKFIDLKINGINVKYLSPDGTIDAATYERISRWLRKKSREKVKESERYLVRP